MIMTFIIEIIFAIYTLARYKFDAATKLTTAILFCLAMFQFAEFNVCEGAVGLSNIDWARVGFITITMLPVLGLHLGMVIAHRMHSSLIFVAYFMAILFGLYFAMSPVGIVAGACLGNYVIFNYAPMMGNLYSLYYFGWLAVGAVFAWTTARSIRNRHQSLSLKWLAAGYMAFIVPSAFVTMIDASTIRGIPSIMCGFAVLLAFSLAFKVMPEYRKSLVSSKRK